MRNVFASVCALCFASVLFPTQSRANPLGGSVVGGDASATIAGEGTTLVTIKQNHNRSIINWDIFSIGIGETTKFIQPSATAAILNRVTSANPSLLYGTLEANGRVFLINPAGVLVGPNGVINTRGFLASTFDIGNEAFLAASKLTLSGASTASVRNEGTINALGGDVFLIAGSVQNSGSIQASGTVGLAAGSQVLLAQAGTERIAVQAGNSPQPGQGIGVDNQGQIQAATAELKAAGGNMYALAINNGGVIRATSAVNEGGKIYLRAAGGNIQNSGTLSASSTTGNGGTVIVDGGHNAANAATVSSSGVIEAASATGKGGKVEVLGDQVGLFDHARVDVSGGTGGGTALIGGDYRGANPGVQNALRTFVGPDASINADAVQSGNGGKVIVWSDDITRFYGSLSARGGAQSGNGGFAEVSGKDNLDFNGLADLSAAHGSAGTLLLDPKFIYVMNGGTNLAASWQTNAFADDPSGTNFLSAANLEAQLTNNNVVLQANTDIIFSNNVSVQPASGNGSLTLEAGRSILFSNLVSIVLQPGGAFMATVNDANADPANRDPGPGSFWMAPNASIRAPGGITIQAGSLATVSDGLGGTTNVGVAANTGDLTLANLFTTNLSVSSLGSLVLTNARVDQDASLVAATNLNLSAVFVTNNLTAVAMNGSIIGSGSVNVGQLAALQAANGNILLTNAANELNLVQAAGNTVKLRDADTAGNQLTLTGVMAQDLTVVAGGSILQSGAVNVANTTRLSAGQDIVLSNGANDFGGLVTVSNAQNVSLVDANSLLVTGHSASLNATAAGGDLTFAGYVTTATGANSLVGQASGNISQTGVLEVAGDSSFTAGPGQDILLGSFPNVFGGAVSVGAAAGNLANVALWNVATNAPSPTGLGQVTNSLTVVYENSSLQLSALNLSNDLTVVAGGTISQSGAWQVGGPSRLAATNSAAGAAPDILLAGFNNTFGGPVLLKADGSAQIRNGGNLTVGNWGAGVGSNLTLVVGGNLGQTNGLTVAGSTFLSAGGNVALTNAGNDFGALVTVTNGLDVALTDINDLSVMGVGASRNLTLHALGGNLTLAGYAVSSNLSASASQDILQSGALYVTNTTGLSAGRNIVLSNAGNDFVGAVTVSRGLDVTLSDGNSLVVRGASSNLTAQALSGDLTLAGYTVTNTLSAAASQDILQTGALHVANTTDLSAGRNIVLTNPGNDFVGLVTVNNGLDVNLVDANSLAVTGASSNLTVAALNGDVTLAGYSVMNNLGVSASRDILQTGALYVTNTTGLVAGRNIVLTNPGNDFVGLVRVTNGLDVALVDANSLAVTGTSSNLTLAALNGDVTLAGYAVANNLSASASRDVLQTAALYVTNTTGFSAGRNVVLTNGGNDFVGLVTVNAGSDVTLRDGNSLAVSGASSNLTVQALNGNLTLAGYTATNSLSATASQNILQTAGVSVTNLATLTALGGNIVLTNTANDFNVVQANAQNVTLADANSITVANSVVGTDLTVSAADDIALYDAQVGRNVRLAAGGNASIYTVANPTNFVGGNLVLTAGTNASVGSTVVGNDLSVTASQGIAQANQVSVGRDAAVSAGSDADLGAVAVGRDTTLIAGHDANAIHLAVGRNFTAAATNNVTLSDTSVGGNATLTAQLDVGLNGVSVTNNLVATAATGNITGAGFVSVGGQTSLGAGNDITVADANNDFGGLVTIRNGRNVALTAQHDLALTGTSTTLMATGLVGSVTLAGYTTTGDLSATAGNRILVTGTLNLGADATLTADAISLNAPVRAGTSGLVLLQPLSASANLTISGALGGSASYSGLNNVHAGILRVGNVGDFTGNITITQPIVLGQHTSDTYDPVAFPSQAAADTTTLSLWTHGGAVSESASGFLKVPRLSLQAGTVALGNVNNDVYFIAGAASSVFYVDANSAQTLASPIDGLIGFTGSFSIVKSAGQGEAADTERGFNIGVEVPIAKARISEVELLPPDKAAYQKLVDEAIGGTESVWMSYALNWVPEPQVDKEAKYRIENNSKWVAGGFEFGGSTAGPQQGR